MHDFMLETLHSVAADRKTYHPTTHLTALRRLHEVIEQRIGYAVFIQKVCSYNIIHIRLFVVTVQISSATPDLMLIQ